MTDSSYATTSEVAKYFRISKATVLAMVRSGEIPQGTYVRTGRVFRFDLPAVNRHLLQSMGQPTIDASPEAQMEFDFGDHPEDGAVDFDHKAND